jgi:hypothetical protein
MTRRKNNKATVDNGTARYAVVGLGSISQIAALSAFAGASENSHVAALVSGDPNKLRISREVA